MAKIKSWADEDDAYDEEAPPSATSKVDGNLKILKIKVPKTVAARKKWKKFGKAADDPPGPNPSNTICCEDVFITFINSKDSNAIVQEDIQNLANKNVKCRFCEMDHWTLKCPYKEKFLNKDGDGGSGSGSAGDTGKYIPPGLREGGNKRGDLVGSKTKDEANTIRVTNLPEEIQDGDIKDLFTPFGKIVRIFLAKDKYTGQSKGFAFVSFDRREDAAKAIKTVNGFGYANLILNVEWAKPSNNS